MTFPIYLEIEKSSTCVTRRAMRIIALGLFASDPRVSKEVDRLMEQRQDEPARQDLLGRMWNTGGPVVNEIWDRVEEAIVEIQKTSPQ
jgi:hypothetical protein